MSQSFLFFFFPREKIAIPHHNCTFHGLHDWSSNMFEKFGWMVLAKRNKHKDTIKSYIRGLRHLHNEIIQKHKETTDTDRRKDLEELLSNVDYLAETAKECLQ